MQSIPNDLKILKRIAKLQIPATFDQQYSKTKSISPPTTDSVSRFLIMQYYTVDFDFNPTGLTDREPCGMQTFIRKSKALGILAVGGTQLFAVELSVACQHFQRFTAGMSLYVTC